jgi:hypothetical protein
MRNSTEADARWRGITRPYSPADVERVRGSLRIEHTLARRGAEKLWQLLLNEDYVAALGALTGNQAMQQVKAGLKAIYVSGWQVAADANLAGQMYPDQSLYPANSVPELVRRINHALQRAVPEGTALRFVDNHFGRRLSHFELGIRFLDLRGVLFELGGERLYLLLLLRDRCPQVLNFEIEHGLVGSVGNGLGPDA